jgi:hydroxymethylbilane synthase
VTVPGSSPPSAPVAPAPDPVPADAEAREIRIGTRASALALVQAGIVQEALAGVGCRARLTTIVTEGDRRSPDTAWGEGAFVGAIEQALLDGSVDVAVHSAKDVPTDEDPRLPIAAYLRRAGAEDVLVLPGFAAARDLADPVVDPVVVDPDAALDVLPRGARVGTDSPRRTAFLLARRPDLRLHPLHGNVDTRLRRLDAGETDALVLARAGLERLGLTARISATLPTDVVPPAPGQGALAIQVRADDAETRAVVADLDDHSTRRAVIAERALLAASGGGCRAPLGALASADGDRLHLIGGFATPDGAISVKSRATSDGPGHDAEATETVLRQLVNDAAAAAAELGRPLVVTTRTEADSIPLRLALIDHGLVPRNVPAIDVALRTDAVQALDAALHGADWVVITSRYGARALIRAARPRPSLRLAVVGRAVARTLRAAGFEVAVVPVQETAAALADAIPLGAGEHVVVVRGDLAPATLAERLAARGASVRTVVAYSTAEAPATSLPTIRDALADRPVAVVLASGSAARGWLALADAAHDSDRVRSIPCIAIGRSTAAEAGGLGLVVAATSPQPDPGTVARTTADAITHLQERP